MLIRFSAGNFLSFKETINFCMTASSERIHPHHVLRATARNHPHLLRMAAMYGPNAAGKSNLVKALKFVRHLVVEGLGPGAEIPVQRFRLDSTCLQEPAQFAIEFRVGTTNYAYAFAVNRTSILSEQLQTITNSTETLLFSRETSPEGTVTVRFGPSLSRKSKRERQFLDFIARGTRPNQLFVRESIDRNVHLFRPIYDWFRRTLTIIEPSTNYQTLEIRLGTDEDFRAFLVHVLKAAGTGISDVRTEEVQIEAILNPTDELQRLQSQLSEGDYIFIRGPEGRRFALEKRQDTLRALKITTVHGGKQTAQAATFETHEESDGTQRLFDLLPMLYDLDQGGHERVYVVDEIGRSMHPHLTNMIVNMHLDPDHAHTSSQLIITTHETNLLDLDILRRDEIWFVEKKADASTDLYALSDFQPRYDKDIRRDYLVGRYGAIPFIGNIRHLRLPSTKNLSTTQSLEEEHATEPL